MQEIKAEKLLIKAEKLLKRFIKILWQNKLKLFLAFLGVIAITGGVILATGGSFTVNTSPELSLTDGLVGYWTFDGDDIAGTTAYDRSGQGNDGTITGTTETAGKVGQALEFDEGDDDINLGNISNLKPAEITVAGWFKWEDFSLEYSYVFSSGDDWNDTEAVQLYYRNSTNSITARVAYDSGNTYKDIRYESPVVGQWYFVAFTYDDSYHGSLYIDGNIVNSDDGTAPIYYVTSSDVVIGRCTGASHHHHKGSIDDVRVYNRALSAEEITRLYKMGESKLNASQNLKLTDGLVGMWSFDGDDIYGTTALDKSGQGRDGAITGATKTAGKVGQALEFDGDESDYITITDIDLDYITITAWVNAELGTEGFIVSKDYDGTSVPYSLNIGDSSSFGGIAFYDGGWKNSSAVTDIRGDGWHFIAGAYNGTTLMYYVDGVLDSSSEEGSGVLPKNNNVVDIGRYANTSSYFNGTIDEPRIYNRVLSADEIKRLYKMGESKLNASQNLKLTDGLVGSWSFNGPDIYGTTAYDRSGQGNDGTITGATKTAGKIGQALEFDGDGDYIDVGTDNSLNLYDDFTFSCWANVDSYGEENLSLYSRAETVWITIVDETGELRITQGGEPGWAFASSDKNITLGEWTHLVVAKNSSDNIDFYFDGVLNSSATLNLASDTSATAIIGDWRDINRPFRGKIDEVRIYNRALSQAEITRLYNMGK